MTSSSATASRSPTLHPAQLVLSQARGRADDRGRHPAIVRRRTCTSCWPAFDVDDADRQLRGDTSTRWSTGSGSASACWRSARASRCCPRRALSFALAKVPAGAVTTDAAPAALLLAPGRAARGQTVPVSQRSALKQRARRRDHVHVRRMPRDRWATARWGRLPALKEQNAKLDEYLAKGKSRDEIIAAFVGRSRRPGRARLADRRGLQPAWRGSFRIVASAPYGSRALRTRRAAVDAP